MQTPRQRAPEPTTPYVRWLLAILCLGLLISAVMVARSQVTIDQYNLLARGWRLAFQSEWIVHGVRATGGGNHPGGVTSLAVGLNRSMACLDFTGLGGPGAEPLGGLLFALRYGLAVPTLLLAGWANWRLWRRRRGLWGACRAADSERRWLEGVLRWSFLGALVVFALSPVGVSGYGVLSLFHLAVLPVVFAVGSLATGRRAKPVLAGIGVYATVLVALGVGLALATPAYRCGGPICATAHFTVPILEADHPMLDDLGIRRSCEVVVDETNGWWPDGLELVSKSRRSAPESRPMTAAAGEKPAASSAGTGS